MSNEVYSPSDYGKKEEAMMRKFNIQLDDDRDFFLSCIKPRLDRSYKLFIAHSGDRAKEIKSWQCISEDTEILSFNGWKKMGELKKGDEVLSYEIETGKILPDTVNKTFSYDVDGDMVSIKNAYTDQLVTTNHRLLVKKNRRKSYHINGIEYRKNYWEEDYIYMKAEKILKKGGTLYRFPLAGNYDGELSIGEDLAELIGWFLTDGCFPKAGPIYMTQSKPETLKKLRELLVKMKIDFREWSRPKIDGNYDEHRFYFNSKDKTSKKIKEIIPDRKPVNSLFHLNLKEKNRLLEGIGYGDGSRSPDGSLHVIHKPYKQFRDWMQIFLHLMGRRSTSAEKYVTVTSKDTLDVRRQKHIKLVKYNGKVWSISTNRSNYIARRNGKIFITGNSNISIPYVQAVIETLMPRILDARPDFSVQGRNADDQRKASKIEDISSYTWEKSGMDETNETLVRSSLIYGTGFLQVSWKKDVRTQKFLSTKDLSKKKYVWKKEEKTFYDAPYAEWVDNYDLWYDWHNVPAASKQHWFKRSILTGAEIKRRYPFHDPKRLELAFNSGGGDLTDYAQIRNEVKTVQDKTIKNANVFAGGNDRYESASIDSELQMYEVFEWWRPFDDEYSVHIGGSHVPILKKGSMPIPYNFKEAPFIDFPYLKIPGEFEGYGLAMILEEPQIMLNLIKNQRLDAMTLNIHKMWIVNPLANIDKKELVTRPFGIIYSTSPEGVREVQFSDVKASAYKEEELLKGDMRYASGVDDFSMGAGGSASSATEVRHLRESTLERVRLFVNHLGNGYAKLMRYWISMYGQFFTKDMTIRIIGDDGAELFPLVEKDDLMGEFDFKAAVLPSIAGQMDIEKKQGMDLFQLLIELPFVDPKKLTNKILHSWNWDIDNISKNEQAPQEMIGPDGQPMPGAMGPDGQPMPPGMPGIPGMPEGMMPPGMEPKGDDSGMPKSGGGDLSPQVIQNALAMMEGGGGSGFNQASAPMNLLKGGAPGTAKDIKPKGKANSRGHNRTGKVDTNIASNDRGDAESRLAGSAVNLQS